MNSISLLTSLKDARTRRLPESTARSGRARDLPRRGRCAIVQSMRTTTSHDLDGRSKKKPSKLAPSQQKDRKIKQIQKNERKAFWTLAVTSQCRTSGLLRASACPKSIWSAARQWQGAQKSLASAGGGQPSAPKSPLAERRSEITPISGQKTSLRTVKLL